MRARMSNECADRCVGKTRSQNMVVKSDDKTSSKNSAVGIDMKSRQEDPVGTERSPRHCGHCRDNISRLPPPNEWIRTDPDTEVANTNDNGSFILLRPASTVPEVNCNDSQIDSDVHAHHPIPLILRFMLEEFLPLPEIIVTKTPPDEFSFDHFASR